MLSIFKKNKCKFNQKNVVFLIFFICLIYGLFFNTTDVLAADPNPIMIGIVTVLGWIAFFLSYVVGFVATILIDVLIWVAQFNNIIGVDAVRQGWVIVRDLCNMFFILILLVIAFATILRIESYSAKRLLPKLLIMAVLINFSKTIFGLIIDFSQVIMLTFVNGFAANGPGHFVSMFQMQKYFSMSEVSEQAFKSGSALPVAAGILMGLFAMIISAIVILVLLVVLVFRIIMLWVYTILSPLVFFGAAFPGGQKYTSRIWEDFIKQVLVGPLLAFFIWLALLTAGTSSGQLGEKKDIGAGTGATTGGEQIAVTSLTSPNALFSTNNFQSYVITIALLIGGLMVTQTMGGVAGSMAGKGMQWARRAPMLTGKGALGGAGWGARKFAAWKHGFEIRPTKIISGWKETLADKTRRENIDIETKAATQLREGKLIRGALGASRDFSEEATRGFLWHRAWKGKDSTIQRTWRAGRIRKEIIDLEKQKEKKDITNQEKVEIDSKIMDRTKSLEDIKTPYTFYADQKRNAAYREKMGKFYDIDNEDQLATMFVDFTQRGEKELAAAVVMHAAKVGHSNEMQELVPALKDVYDDKGKLITKRGNNFISGPEGARALFDQYFVGKLGMSEQETLSVASQYSTLAKQANHYNVSEMVGVDKGGLLRWRTASEQMERASSEIMKTDPEGSLRRGNRLMHMSEIQYTDNRNKIDRVAIVTELTERNFLKQAPAMDVEVNKRKRLNQNYAENLYKNFKIARQQKKTGDLQGLPFQLESILDVMQEKYKDQTYTDADGKTRSMVQLAAQALKLGKEKYDGTLKMKITTDIKKSKEEKNAELDELNKDSKEIDEELNAILKQFPQEEPQKKSKKESKEKRFDADAKNVL